MPRVKSLKVIEREIRKLQKEAEQLRQREKPGIKALQAVLSKYKLTSADVKLAMSTPRRSTLRGSKVAPKYRNPKDKSQTWSGRGLKPKWLVALLKQGRKLENFAV